MTAAPQPVWRLIPLRLPPVAASDAVATAADLVAVTELEGWTNDRPVRERVLRLPRSQWFHGMAKASAGMAALFHAAPDGGRFNGPLLGAYYAAASERTAIADVAHHLRREASARGLTEGRRVFRGDTCRIDGADYLDLRGAAAHDVLSAILYAASQPFAQAARGGAGSSIRVCATRSGPPSPCSAPG